MNLVDPSGHIAVCFEGYGGYAAENSGENWTKEDLPNKNTHVCGVGLNNGHYDPDLHGEIFYYANSFEDDIVDAYAKIKEAIEENPSEVIILIGYSWGGAAAVDLAQRINNMMIGGETNVEIDLLFLIDPVLASRGTRNPPTKEVIPFVPSNVKRAYNLKAGGELNLMQSFGASKGESIPGAFETTLQPVLNPQTGVYDDAYHGSMTRFDETHMHIALKVSEHISGEVYKALWLPEGGY